MTTTLNLASLTHFRKEGKGLVNCVYKLCATAWYRVVQSHCSVLSHDTLRHRLDINSSLIFSATAEAVKMLKLYILLGIR